MGRQADSCSCPESRTQQREPGRFLQRHTCPLFLVHMGKTAFAFKCYLSLVAVVAVAPRWLRPCLACPSSLAIRMHHELLGPQTAVDYGDDDADADDGGNSEF